MIGELQFKVADHVANDVPKGPTGAACVHCEDFVDTAKILLMPAGLVSTFHGPCCACRGLFVVRSVVAMEFLVN